MLIAKFARFFIIGVTWILFLPVIVGLVMVVPAGANLILFRREPGSLLRGLAPIDS
jgi:hypothetical protein